MIQGGESGRNARPFDIAWAESLIDRCDGLGVPYFLKQLGSHVVEDGTAADLRRRPCRRLDRVARTIESPPAPRHPGAGQGLDGLNGARASSTSSLMRALPVLLYSLPALSRSPIAVL